MLKPARVRIPGSSMIYPKLGSRSLSSVVIPTIPEQRSGRLGRVGIAEAGYAQGLASPFQSIRWFHAKHQLQDWTDGPGGQLLVYVSPAEIRLMEKEEADLKQPWSDFDPYLLVGTSIFFTMVIRTHTSNLEWEAC